VNITLSIGGAAGIESTLLRCASLSADDVANEARAWTEKATKDNFLKYGSSKPNQFGGANTTSYWLRASDATRATATGGTITIEVFESRGTGGTGGLVGVRRHYTGGGTIKPSGRISEITKKPIQYLTIPINAAAHGLSAAALMQKLGVDIYRKGSALFMHPKGSERSDSDTAVFALKKSIKPQRPNPSILPTDTEYYAAINTAVDELLDLD
jgi:hypothetical protein